MRSAVLTRPQACPRWRWGCVMAGVMEGVMAGRGGPRCETMVQIRDTFGPGLPP